MEIKEIEQDINKRNFKRLNSKHKVLHLFGNTKTKINTILIINTEFILVIKISERSMT